MRNYQVIPLTLLAVLSIATSSDEAVLPHEPPTDRISESIRLLEETVNTDHYSADEMEEFRVSSHHTMERLRSLPLEPDSDEAQPLPPEAAEQLRQAQLEIENIGDYTGAWNWLRVRAVALQFSTSIPAVFINRQETEIRSAWDNGGWRLIIFPRLIGEAHHSFMATIIHEATHAVVTEELIRYSGFTAHEIFLLRLNCEEFSRELAATTEVLAYVNSGMWKRMHDTPVQPIELWTSEAFHTIPATDWSDIGHATEAMMEYIYDAREANLGVETLPNCGHIVAERGPHRGEIVRPGIIAPDYMGPIFLHLAESQ